jgi:hypothetical protein
VKKYTDAAIIMISGTNSSEHKNADIMTAGVTRHRSNKNIDRSFLLVEK